MTRLPLILNGQARGCIPAQSRGFGRHLCRPAWRSICKS